MSPFSFDHLDDTEFENFCHDLISDMGFVNVDWRKGTGLSSSPSDRGRDIVAELLCKEVDGTTYFETWFFECKHHKKGISPSKIRNALTWADAERPNRLVIIASNFLSNPTKDYLNRYIDEHKPTYKIIRWERPMLEKLMATRSKLLKKYRISGEYPFLSIMHPTHIMYLREMPFNSLNYLLNCMDDLPPEKRDMIFGDIYLALISPSYRKSTTGKETMAELQIDRVDYGAFKERCFQIIKTGLMDEFMLTYLIISFTLQDWFGLGDTTGIDKAASRLANATEFFKSQIEKRPEEREHFSKMVANGERWIAEMPATVARNYELYTYFCEYILEKLRLEKHLSSAKEIDKELYEDMVRFHQEKRKETSL